MANHITVRHASAVLDIDMTSEFLSKPNTLLLSIYPTNLHSRVANFIRFLYLTKMANTDIDLYVISIQIGADKG